MRKNVFIAKSRLRGYMQKYTESEHLIDICMRVSGQLVGFECVDEDHFYKEDRKFMKRLKRISNDRIDTFALGINHVLLKREVPRIIKSVKEDLRSMA